MICLRKLSGFGVVPTIVDLVRQSRLRWLGHVGRMPNHRLPKRLLFGVLPEDVGTPRPPGRQKGIRLRDVLSQDLDAVGIGRQGWLQFCNSAEGDLIWRQKSRACAIWYNPHRVAVGQDPPDRAQELKRILHGKASKKPSTWERWTQSECKIRETFIPKSAFLRLEQDLGGRTGLLERFDDPQLRLPALPCLPPPGLQRHPP